MPSVVALRTQLGSRAKRIGNSLRCAFVIRCECNPHVTVIEDGIVRPVCLLDLVQRLRDEKGAQAVTCHEGESAFEEVESPKRRELIKHEEHLASRGVSVADFQRLSEPATDLIQNQTNEG